MTARTAELDGLHAAAVAGLMAAPDRPCSLCGVPLHTTALPDDTYGVADWTGSRTGTDPDLAPLCDPAANWLGASNPYAYLARLARLLDEADPGSKKTQTTWLYERTVREYAALKVRLDMGLSFHYHQEDRAGAPRSLVVPPYHCSWPAHLRPSGWYCRECKVRLPGA